LDILTLSDALLGDTNWKLPTQQGSLMLLLPIAKICGAANEGPRESEVVAQIGKS
jgi:hypothetical protein